MKKRLIIIDGNAIVHRSYHALPPFKDSRGEKVNALYGFLLFLLKSIKDFEPDFIAATFDLQGPTFRHKEYDKYKAKREKAPDDLYSQIPKIKKALKVFKIPIFEKRGFEADDVIGTISKIVSSLNIEVIILTGDLDVLQLVNKKTKAYILKRGIKKGVLYDEEKVKERYDGLLPSSLVEFKSLRGDQSDNIPGIPGIGEKTAITLIKEFGSISNMYKSLKNSKINKKLVKKIIDGKNEAELSRKLLEIRKDVPIAFALEKCKFAGYNKEKVTLFFKKYNFKSLVLRINNDKMKKKENLSLF